MKFVIKLLIIILPILILQNGAAQGEKQKVKGEIKFEIEGVKIRSKGITKFGSSVKVEKDEVVEGDVVVFGGSIEVDGKVKGDVVVFGGSIEVDGEVKGDVVAIGGSIKVNKTAVIEGDITTIGGGLNVEEGAKVKGEQVTIGGLTLKLFSYPTLLLFKLGMVIVYIILLILIPKPMDVIANTVITHPGKSFLFGILAGILFLPICIFLAITIIGIILIPLIIIGYIATLLVGWLAVAQQIGSKLLAIIKKEKVVQFIRGITGVIFLEVVLLIPIANIIIWFIIVNFGFGACILSKFGTKHTFN